MRERWARPQVDAIARGPILLGRCLTSTTAP